MIISNFHPVVGGTENQALLLCRALMQRGLGVAVLTRRVPGLPAAEQVGGVRVNRSIRVIDRGKLFGVTYFLTCLAYLVSHRSEYDIIHCHILHGFHSLAALFVKLLFGKKVVIKVASSGALSDFLMLKNSLCGAWMLGFLTYADRVIALCRTSAAEARGHGFPDARITVIPNGVDADRFVPAHGPAPGRSRLVYAGSLNAAKGLDVLIDAFSRLKERHAELMLDIFGSGPLEASLRHAAAAPGLAGSVALHGRVTDLERHFDGTCIFVQPSLVEGMSNVILEAMAAGLPVVATRAGAAGDIIEDGATGLLVDPGSARQIQDAVLRLLCDEGLADRIGRAARALIESRYGIAQVAASYHALYRELIGPERAGGAIRPYRET
jgi:glycosyltransferase involved in cell wall biosynthesis